MRSLSSPAPLSSSYLKAVLPRRDINSSQVSQGFELGIGVITKEGQDRNDPIWMDQKFQLIETCHLMKTEQQEGHEYKHPNIMLISKKETQQTRKGIRSRGLTTAVTFHGILTISLPQNNFSKWVTNKWCVHWILSHRKNNFSNSTYLYLLNILGQNLSHILPKSTQLLLFYFIFWSDSS